MARNTQATQDEAAAIRGARDRSAAGVMTSPHLNDAGKKLRLAQIQLAAMDEMDALQASAEAERESLRQTNLQAAFGSVRNLAGADVIARRDATDRAAQLETPDDALQALSAAQIMGDRFMAQAIGQVAFQNVVGSPFQQASIESEWLPVLQAFVGSDDLLGQRVQWLIDDATPPGLFDAFNNAGDFELVVGAPDPIAGLDRLNLEQLIQNAQAGVPDFQPQSWN